MLVGWWWPTLHVVLPMRSCSRAPCLMNMCTAYVREMEYWTEWGTLQEGLAGQTTSLLKEYQEDITLPSTWRVLLQSTMKIWVREEEGSARRGRVLLQSTMKICSIYNNNRNTALSFLASYSAFVLRVILKLHAFTLCTPVTVLSVSLHLVL